MWWGLVGHGEVWSRPPSPRCSCLATRSACLCGERQTMSINNHSHFNKTDYSLCCQFYAMLLFYFHVQPLQQNWILTVPPILCNSCFLFSRSATSTKLNIYCAADFMQCWFISTFTLCDWNNSLDHEYTRYAIGLFTNWHKRHSYQPSHNYHRQLSTLL